MLVSDGLLRSVTDPLRCLPVSSCSVDCLDRLVSEITCYASRGTFNTNTSFSVVNRLLELTCHRDMLNVRWQQKDASDRTEQQVNTDENVVDIIHRKSSYGFNKFAVRPVAHLERDLGRGSKPLKLTLYK